MNTSIRTVEDVVKYNIDNKGTKGAAPGDHPAFRTGQVGQALEEDSLYRKRI
jgi:hypothetical protein